MIATKQFTFIVLALVLITPFICAQVSRSVITLSQGINLMMNPLDQFSRTLGLRDEEIVEAARGGIESNRWKLSESSDLVVSVSVNSLPQREEDLYPFRVEVHGGTSHESSAGKEFSLEIIGDIPAVKTIAVPWGDHSKILTTVEELATSVSAKLRREVIRRQFRK